MWKLVIEDDEAKRTSVPLTRDDYTIGRKEGNTIRLTERNVSREHAKIHKPNGVAPGTPPPEGSGFVLEDCNSYNGVYVNGLRVAAPQPLGHGDLIQIGDYRIVLQDEAFSAPEAGAATTTQDIKNTMPMGVVNRGSMLMERPNRLVMLAGPTPGAEYPFDETLTTIGRAEECTVSVNHNSVSRLHCQIHALGEGRYEVVDKGSSNGVRVNGSDLRRSIIEPGDILELGDVRFRFVGAGQIFLPGVGDSQQLEAIPDRPPSSLRPQPTSTTSLTPFVIVGAVVAVGVVVGFALMQRQTQQPFADTSHVASDDPEQIELQAAKKLCDDGKCDLAHDKLMVKIDAKSPVRSSADFQNIETRWADGQLAAADRETDLGRKRKLLKEVQSAETVPPQRRSIATAKLAELDAATNVTSTGTAPIATHTAVVPTGTVTATNTATATTGTVTAPTATHTATHPSGGSAFSQASALVTSGDNAGARALLEPRVFGAGKASSDEVSLLKGICRQQRDKNCVTAIAQKYP
jgi:pSer/pThr/pTyr-binding forkhead associated (FHA) protein